MGECDNMAGDSNLESCEIAMVDLLLVIFRVIAVDVYIDYDCHDCRRYFRFSESISL